MLRLRLAALLVLTWSILCFSSGHGWAAATAYRVEMPGLAPELQSVLTTISDCVTLQDRPPDTPGLLTTRMHNDLESFNGALSALGYFTPELEGSIDFSASPVLVRFHISPGPRFTFARPQIHLDPPSPTILPTLDNVLSHQIKSGSGYASSLVVEAENDLLNELRKYGYPAPSLKERTITADHKTKTVQVHLALASGPQARFAPSSFEGLQGVGLEHATKQLAWKSGDLYDSRLVDRTRENLVRTGLFRSVLVDHKKIENGRITMRIQVLESPHRTVRSGLWYYSSQGLGGSLGWTHRNLFGGGQELGLDADLAEKQKSLTTTLTLPGLGHPDQTLGMSMALQDAETDGYDARSLGLSAVLTRDFGKFRLGYGLAYRLSDIDKDVTRHFNLISIPLSAELSTVDNVLDPASGLALSSRLEPFSNIEDSHASFLLWSISGAHYLSLKNDKSLILATRGRYAVLAGSSRSRIPDDLLLYAGGGGSVRGYAYQYAGDLDHNDDPAGGLSAVDLTAELRWRATQNLGFALFGEGGRAFANRTPTRFKEYFWAAGTGLRYYTPIGPVRLDVAIPLNPRHDIDDPFQVYVSLGQAF